MTQAEVTKKYYCDKCKEFVSPIKGEFYHPDKYSALGRRSGYACPKCGYLVYLKEE